MKKRSNELNKHVKLIISLITNVEKLIFPPTFLSKGEIFAILFLTHANWCKFKYIEVSTYFRKLYYIDTPIFELNDFFVEAVFSNVLVKYLHNVRIYQQHTVNKGLKAVPNVRKNKPLKKTNV